MVMAVSIGRYLPPFGSLKRWNCCVQVGVFAERFAFIVEWLDANSGITWKYQLLYFPETKEVEMVGQPLAANILLRCLAATG